MRFPEVNYLPEEHSCWNAIYTRLENIWPSTACKEFLEGHQVLLKSGLLNRDRIPDVSKISKLLESKTGFRLRPATGLCPAREFLACLGMVLFTIKSVTRTMTLDRSFNSRGPEQKTYLSFGTDLAHVIDLTESLIIGNENIAQNVELE